MNTYSQNYRVGVIHGSAFVNFLFIGVYVLPDEWSVVLSASPLQFCMWRFAPSDRGSERLGYRELEKTVVIHIFRRSSSSSFPGLEHAINNRIPPVRNVECDEISSFVFAVGLTCAEKYKKNMATYEMVYDHRC